MKHVPILFVSTWLLGACGPSESEDRTNLDAGTGEDSQSQSDSTTTPSGCAGAQGAHLLSGTESHSVHEAWLWLQEDGNDCRAVLAPLNLPGRSYAVAVANAQIVVTPNGAPAISGHEGLTSHRLVRWNKITLHRDATGLTDTAVADVIVDWDEEDIWGEDPMKMDLSVLEPASPALSDAQPTLPWRMTSVFSSHPVDSLATMLVPPSPEWSVEDIVDGVGIVEAQTVFTGEWDDVRGQTLMFGVHDGLKDLAGALTVTTKVNVPVRDIGPAVDKHEMFSTSGLATWGTVVELKDGECATTGCLHIVDGSDGYAGIAGQIATTDKTTLSLVMRLWGDETNVATPDLFRIEVIARDGTLISPTTGGTFAEELVQTWTYDVTGHDKVGFSLESANYNHDWGASFIVDEVRAD